mmetsp:Transcript_10954/g.13427  ORF Transcript_10954/g.13427 Transcript_10954/m.13427 type:complete len:80 (+) Transcript_10954:337-576(+)
MHLQNRIRTLRADQEGIPKNPPPSACNLGDQRYGEEQSMTPFLDPKGFVCFVQNVWDVLWNNAAPPGCDRKRNSTPKKK